MFTRVTQPKLVLVIAALMASWALVTVGPAARADTLPTGERLLGQVVLEPAYNDANGGIVYLPTPTKAQVNPNSHNTAPLYVVMYPTSVATTIGTVNCQHQPMDNCPDHGPLVAAIAMGLTPLDPGEPAVYGHGVWGHDHLLAAPASGGDFNIDWLPIEVLFTNAAAASTHITTLAQLHAAEAAGNVREIPLPFATFHCSVVGAAPYNMATPVMPAPPTP